MRRPGFLIVGLIVFGSVALGLAALAGNISLRERNIVPSTSFRPGAATHQTRAESPGALQFSKRE